jgi:hypothetical protein
MTMPQAGNRLVKSVLHEIDDLHRFFTLWFGGRVRKNGAVNDRFDGERARAPCSS